MYLIVFIVRWQTFAVIPEKWLYDIEKQMEKFCNISINVTQWHTCFWTDSQHARDVEDNILENFEPNFNASWNNEFPHEGCYFCQVVRARGSILSGFFKTISIHQ